MMEQWVLLWLFLAPSSNIETRIPYAAVKQQVLMTQDECKEAMASQLDVNDTRYMIAHGDGRLVCVKIPSGEELPWP